MNDFEVVFVGCLILTRLCLSLVFDAYASSNIGFVAAFFGRVLRIPICFPIGAIQNLK